MRYIQYDTRSILNKILGMIYFLLGGIMVFLSFYLPSSVLQDMSLKYVIPILFMLFSLVLIIQGYLKLTEGEKSLLW